MSGLTRTWLFVFSLAASPVAAEARVGLPVVFHVARTASGQPVRSGPDLAREFEIANRHFADAGLGFSQTASRELPVGSDILRTIRERRMLRRHLVQQVVNVFVFAEILDPVPSEATRRAAARVGRSPSGALGGGHIPAPGHRPSTYIILSVRGGPLALTHELGHFLGAPHHPDPENIMSYGSDRNHFDARQLALFSRRVRSLIRTRALLPICLSDCE